MAKKFKVTKGDPRLFLKSILRTNDQAGLMAGEGTSGRRDDKEHSSFPGDKLPEHHFKKK